MNCIMCDNEAGYNRAVTDVLSGQRVGRLCRNCELEHFGGRLESRDTVADSGCAFCDRDGYYALPKFTATVEEVDGRLTSTTSAEVTEATAQICDLHLEEMERFTGERAAVEDAKQILYRSEG